jgi:hypothetical protein
MISSELDIGTIPFNVVLTDSLYRKLFLMSLFYFLTPTFILEPILKTADRQFLNSGSYIRFLKMRDIMK